MLAAWRRIEIRQPSIWLSRDPYAEEKMLRCVPIASAVETRCGKVAGRHWILTPRVPTDPRGDLAVAVGTELLGGLRKFSAARKLLAKAFFHGSRGAVIHTELRPMAIGDGRLRNWVVPVKLEDQSRFRYRKKLPDPHGDHPKAHWERWEILGKDSGQWVPLPISQAQNLIRHVYDDTEESLGYGKGLREQLGWPWWALAHTNQEAIGAIERFARGWVHAKVDGARNAETGLTNTAVVSEWQKKLQDMQSKHVIVSSKEDEIEVVVGSAEGWQMISDFRKDLKADIATLVLAANLPTQATQGGSFALSQTQENSTESLVQFDREALEQTLDDSLMACIWHKNHANLVELGIADSKPRFGITQEKIENPQEVATTASTLHAMGVPLSSEDVYDRTGMKKPEENEDQIPGAAGAAADPFAPPVGFGGPPPSTVPGPEPLEIQETALNGAQVQAAAEIIDRVVNNLMPPGTAVRMLTTMFNLPLTEAKAMIDEAVAFVPATPTPADPFSVGVPT